MRNEAIKISLLIKIVIDRPCVPPENLAVVKDENCILFCYSCRRRILRVAGLCYTVNQWFNGERHNSYKRIGPIFINFM